MDQLEEKIFSLLLKGQNDDDFQQRIFEMLEDKIGNEPVQRALLRTLEHCCDSEPGSERFYQSLCTAINDSHWELEQLKIRCRRCQQHNNFQLCRQMIGRAQKYQVESIILPLIYEESTSFIKFVTQCFSFQVDDYIGELDKDDHRAQYLIPEFIRVFGLSDEAIENLYSQTFPGKVRDVLGSFLQIKLGRKLEELSPHPLFSSLPNPEQYVQWLEKKIEVVEEKETPVQEFPEDNELETKKDPVEVKLQVHQLYAISPFYLRLGLLQTLRTATESQELLDEIVRLDRLYTSTYGPVNTLYDADFKEDKSNRCLIYGGCRQFLCTCFESSWEDDDDELLEEWFVGYCQTCHKQLFDQYQCYRKPLLYGGWVGCFCSLECCQMTLEEDQLYNHIYQHTHELLD